MNFDAHIVQGQAPVADAYDGDPATDIVQAAGEGVLFFVQEGVGTTGTMTLTIEACDDTTPSNTTAVPFIYRTNTTSDTWSAWTAATAAGFTTTAGSNHLYQAYVDTAELAEEGYGYVRGQMTESVNAAVLAGVSIWIINPRYQVTVESLID
jgi:hypothetical protein